MPAPTLFRPRWMLPVLVLLAGCASRPPAIVDDTPEFGLRSLALEAPFGGSVEAVELPSDVLHMVVAPHGARRQDEFYWLRDDARNSPRVLAHLEAENRYADTLMAPLRTLEEQLYGEMVGRLQQDDSSVPYRYKGYWYFTRYLEGDEHPLHVRRRDEPGAHEEVVLDVSRLAEGHDYYRIGGWMVSPDQQRVAWLEDTVGRNQFTLRVRELGDGAVHDVAIAGLSATLAWGGDSQSLYYVENDPVTLLTKRVRRHHLGEDPALARTIYEEADESFYLDLMTTRSERYVCVLIESTVASEQRCINAREPRALYIVAPRERGIEYQADHLGNRWVIRTNWEAPNFKLMEVQDGSWGRRSRWTDRIPHDPAVLVGDFALFDRFIAIVERSGGLQRIRVLPDVGQDGYVTADEPAYFMDLATNAEPATTSLRYVYGSLTTPLTTYEFDLISGRRQALKVEPVVGDFDPARYVTERRWATAIDGTAIPVSLVYRRGLPLDGTAPLLQYGYGAYGISIEPAFSSPRLSLLDRGVVYAIAHVRGGQEMGRQWYEDGKLHNKMNSFTDFIAVTDFLVSEGYAAADRVAAMGGSAGGLLVGAVANLAPERYRVVVSQVPFVDVVTTMLDESIPLTTNEYDEWGNPSHPDDYAYMLQYSPYDQIATRDYPAMYVGTGLWDSQVQYWEPAKYVARLRARKTDDRALLLRTRMDAGHSGAAGRFQRYRDTAESYAFMLNELGIVE